MRVSIVLIAPVLAFGLIAHPALSRVPASASRAERSESIQPHDDDQVLDPRSGPGSRDGPRHSGSYFARLHAGEYAAVRKMVLLR